LKSQHNSLYFRIFPTSKFSPSTFNFSPHIIRLSVPLTQGRNNYPPWRFTCLSANISPWNSSNITQALSPPGTYSTASASTWTTCCLQTANRSSRLLTRFPRGFNRRTNSQHQETLQTSSSPTIPNEQLSDAQPPSAMLSRASWHLILPLLAHLPLPITMPLPPHALLYASRFVRARHARAQSVHLWHCFRTPRM